MYVCMSTLFYGTYYLRTILNKYLIFLSLKRIIKRVMKKHETLIISNAAGWKWTHAPEIAGTHDQLS